jgi:hypothetical protein
MGDGRYHTASSTPTVQYTSIMGEAPKKSVLETPHFNEGREAPLALQTLTIAYAPRTLREASVTPLERRQRHPARLGGWPFVVAAGRLHPLAERREERCGVLLEALGQKEWHTAGRQYLDDLVEHALRHGQRPVPDVDGQQQRGARIHRRPHPVRRARQARDGLRLADRAGLHRAEQRKEFIQLDLRDPPSVQEIPGKRRGMVCDFHQPGQHGIGVDLEYPGQGADAQAFREGADHPYQQVGGHPLAMPRCAVRLLEIAMRLPLRIGEIWGARPYLIY